MNVCSCESVSLWDRNCLDLRGYQTPNLRIHAECSNHLSHRGQIFAVPCCWILALAVEIWSSLNSTWLRRRGEWPLLLAKPSSVHGWTGRELRPGNCHGLPWWLWIPSPCPCFFAPPTTSFLPLVTTNCGASQEMTPAECASLQDGPSGVFSHPVGVQSRGSSGGSGSSRNRSSSDSF